MTDVSPERKNSTPMAMVSHVTVSSRYFTKRAPTMIATTARKTELCNNLISIFLFWLRIYLAFRAVFSILQILICFKCVCWSSPFHFLNVIALDRWHSMRAMKHLILRGGRRCRFAHLTYCYQAENDQRRWEVGKIGLNCMRILSFIVAKLIIFCNFAVVIKILFRKWRNYF